MIQSCTLNAINAPEKGNMDASMEYVACQMAPGADPTGQTVYRLEILATPKLHNFYMNSIVCRSSWN